MAQRLDITFKHAIFDTYSYQRGSRPQFVEENKGVRKELQKFLDSGDSVLNDKPGFFFGSIAGQFIIAFEQQRPARRGTENYFDLFWASVSDVNDASVKSAVKVLKNELAPGFNGPVQNQVGVRLETRSAAVSLNNRTSSARGQDTKPDNKQTSADDGSEESSEDESNGESDFVDVKDVAESTGAETSESEMGESGTSESEKYGPVGLSGGSSNWGSGTGSQQSKRISTEFIAQFWEHHRRSDKQLYATLDDVDRFGLAVEGTLNEFSYISNERVENISFDIVSGEFSVQIDTNDLERTVDRLREQDDLSVSNLPTYRDVVVDKKKKNYEELNDPPWLEEDVQNLIDRLERAISAKFDHTTQRAADVFEEAFEDGTVSSDDDGRRISGRVSNVAQELTGKKDPDLPIKPGAVKSDTVDQDLQAEIFEALDFGTIDDSLYQTQEDLISGFESELEELVQEARTQLLKQIIASLEEIHKTEAYTRSNLDSGSKTRDK